MSDKIKDTEKMNENKEITAEDLDGVVGGRAPVNKKIPHLIGLPDRRVMMMYGGPDIMPKTLPPEVLKKLIKEAAEKEIEQRKKREKEINQVSDLGTDKSSSTR